MEVYLSRSNREGKKWVMRFPTKSVHFGQEGARDRTIIKGKEERIKAYKAYQSRHRNDKINIKDSAGALSWYLLWSADSLTQGITNYEKKFNIKVKRI